MMTFKKFGYKTPTKVRCIFRVFSENEHDIIILMESCIAAVGVRLRRACCFDVNDEHERKRLAIHYIQFCHR